MKKIFITVIFCISLLLTSAYANELEFSPVGGGKFIYCNNPEGIEDDMLLNGETPRWIMNNKNLSPDLYHLYISHFNYTGNGSLGYDIELDVAITAKEDSEITIHNASFGTPNNYAYYENWERTVRETDWGMLNVCSDILGIPMCDIRGNDFYYPSEFTPISLKIKKGDRIWLSDYIFTMHSIQFGKGAHLQALIEIKNGLLDLDIGAVKQIGINHYRPTPDEEIAYGEYRWDYTLKGVADTLPEVEADIEYIIDDTTKNGDKIPVFLKNQYIPEGHTVTGWYTHLNPQNDIWSKTTAAESDILTLKYEDNGKLNHYGSNVTERDNIWTFDTGHSALRKFEARFDLGNKKDFVPNFLLSTEKDNHAYACNIGNYGVATTYNMKISNETHHTKFCTLALTAASEVIAYTTDSKGKKSYAYVKDLTGEKVTDNILSYEIPPDSMEEFKFSIILPVNYNGGILNELVITDESIQAVSFKEKLSEITEENIKNDVRGTKEIHGEYVSSMFSLFPEATAEKVWKSRDGFEYLRGRNNGIIRWMAYDGTPEWYFNLWGYVSTLYMTDENYNITAEYTFPSLPCGASYKDDYFYIKTARDGVYKSKNGRKWTKTNETMPEYIPFYDLENASEWAVPELEDGWDLNIRLKNIAGNNYNFKQPMLREAFCDLAVQVLDKLDYTTNNGTVIEFTDTKNPNILRLTELGVIEGFGDGTFRPSEKITREQAAVILGRMATLIEYENPSTDINYVDFDSISDWATDGVKIVTGLNIMQGIGDNRFDPLGTYSREQSAATMVRFYNGIISLN